MMQRTLRHWTACFAALACTGLMTQALAQTPAPKDGGVLVYATGVDAQTLDPQFVTDIPTFRVVRYIYEPLTQQDVEGKIIPALATSWTVSDDKRTWTFKLRPNVKFHDGSPFNAQAVKFTFDRLLDPATGSPRRSTLAAVSAIKVIDDLTVAVITKEPFAPLLAQLSAYNAAILSPAQAQKAGPDLNKQPSGTGPFKFKSQQPGEKVVLVRNDNYWDGKPHLQGLEIRAVPEASARILQLLGGEVDVISDVPTVMLKRLESSKTVNLMRKTGYRTIYLGMNTTMKPFNDLRVRQAVAYAINKPALVKGVLNGIGTLGGSYESPVIENSATDLPPYPYDKEKARALLKEAGYPDGFSTDFIVPTGRYIMDRQLGEAIQAQLADIGIKVNMKTPEISAYLTTLSKAQAPMFISGKGSPTGDMDFTQTLSNASTGRMNHFAFKNDEVDRLIEQQRVTVDPNQRKQVLHDLQALVYKELPHVTLYYEDQIFAANSKVHDVDVYVNEFVSFQRTWKE